MTRKTKLLEKYVQIIESEQFPFVQLKRNYYLSKQNMQIHINTHTHASVRKHNRKFDK